MELITLWSFRFREGDIELRQDGVVTVPWGRRAVSHIPNNVFATGSNLASSLNRTFITSR